MAYIGKRPGDTFPSDNAITTTLVADNAITAVKIAENAITAREIAANTIVVGNIADNAVDATKIASNSILTRHIDDNQITADQIANDAVGLAQLAGIARGKIILGDANGDPSLLAAGSNGQVLKSDGTDIAWGTDLGKTDEEIQDVAGAMFTGNTETGITATYQDGDGTIDLVVATLNQDTTGTADNVTVTANNSANETVYPVFVDGATGSQGAETDTGLTYNPSTGMLTATGVTATVTGNLTGNVTGNTSGTAATVTGAAQSNITSLGTLTALTVDDVAVDGKVITMTGSSGDTATVTVGTNGTLDITTTDTAAAAANIQITADGTAELAGTTVTLDSAGGVTIDADGGTITFSDGGSSLGTITSSGYTGNVVGNVTGNADTATALANARTIGMSGDVVWSSGSFDGSANVTAAATIQADAVEQSMIADDAVGADQLAANSVVSASIVNGSIVSADIADNTIATGNIADNAIDSTKIAQNSILTRHIDDSQVTNDHLAGSIANSKLANSTITVSDGSNTTATALGGTITFAGTSNEVNVAESSGTITIGLPDDVTIAGDLTVSGTTTSISSTTINVADPLIALATTNNSADAVDIGLYGLYDTSGSQDLYGGLFRDANDSGKWKLFKDNQAAPTTTVNTGGTGYAKATLVADIEGNVTGNVTGNTSGTAATVTTAAQTNITSLGTLTALTVDNVVIDGAVIGHTGDTDLITLSSGVVTVAGEVDATSLDISGDADIDGTLEADAITVDGTTLAEYIADTAGAMFSSNTETNITATYQDADNTIDLVIGTLNQDTTGLAGTATALATARTIGGVSFDGTANINLPGVNTAGDQDTTGTATLATNVTASANNSTDETVYPVFVDGATGSQGIETDTGFTYNPSDGNLTSTTFTGNLTGNVTGNVSGTAGSATGNAATATALANARTIGGTSFDGTANIVPATVTVADTTDTSAYVALFDSATGDLGPKTDAGITYNAGTGMLSATGVTSTFTGNLTGNVTGNASGTALTVTQAAQTAITSLGTLTGIGVDGAATFNESGADVDFRVESDSNTHALFVDASTNRIGINQSSPASDLHITGSGDTKLTLEDGTDEQSLVAHSGGLNYNVVASDNHTFTIGGTDLFGMTSAGEFKVGFSNIADPTITIDSASGGDPQLVFDTGAGNRTGIINFKDQGTAIGFIKYEHNGDKMNFGSGSSTTSTMTVNDGKVGINTTSPSVDLHLYATADDRPHVLIEGYKNHGTNDAPILEIYTNDETTGGIADNTSIGIIRFSGDEKDGGTKEVYAEINALAQDPGQGASNRGKLRLRTQVAGDIADSLVIDGYGNLTTPAGNVSAHNIVTSAPSSGSGKLTGHVWYVV